MTENDRLVEINTRLLTRRTTTGGPKVHGKETLGTVGSFVKYTCGILILLPWLGQCDIDYRGKDR